VAEADGKGRVRGFIENPGLETFIKRVGELRKFDVARAVGREGTLTVVKELGMGTPYTSVVPLVSGEIAIGVLLDKEGRVKHAGGFLLQTLGGVSEKVVDLLEHRAVSLPPLTELMTEGKRPEDIAALILKDLDPQLIGLKEVEYYCPCDEEMEEILSGGPAEVVCRFCGRVYRFGREDLKTGRRKG